jgi:hypothetical protein
MAHCVQIKKMHIFWEIWWKMAKGYVHGVVHILDWGPDKGLPALVLDPQAEKLRVYFSTKSWQTIGKCWMILKGFSISESWSMLSLNLVKWFMLGHTKCILQPNLQHLKLKNDA